MAEADNKELVIRIKDVSSLIESVENLRNLRNELYTTNIRIRPLSPWTKDNWMHRIDEAIEYFEKFLPKKSE